MAGATAQAYTQTGRPLSVNTPLGPDAMLLVGISGTEAISQLYHYKLTLKAPVATSIPFEKLIGQPITVKMMLPDKKPRFLSGICARLEQAESDPTFTDYHLSLVPSLWWLTKRSQSRIFQHITVPDILKKVLAGLDVKFEIQGNFEQRDYCVQYRETDFNFASRLMEEEGIYYFFKHGEGSHTMVVANTLQSHPDVPGTNPITYKTVSHEGSQNEDFINDLVKSQEQVSGKFLLWDHTFELPHEHLDAEKLITDTVKVGEVNHKIRIGDPAKLEIYDYPGEYAQRFDGINTGGGEQTKEIAKVNEDNKRTVDLRMQIAAATAISIRGSGTARQMIAGYKFRIKTLTTDHAARPIKADGEYTLTSVTHSAYVPANYRTGDNEDFRHEVRFTAMPIGLPFRPARTAAKPVVPGTQTAQVVGPPGEEIFTDKYGRIKVQFHWDRDGKRNASSSCWIRVAHLSAGRHWGMMSIPRIGQEVVVDFQEGDPDQPICIGCVYNPDQMPMYTLPKEKTKSYLRTNSSPGGEGYNCVRIEDKAGSEQIYTHAQKNMDTRVRNDCMERIGNDRHLRVGFYLQNDHKGDVSGEQKKGHQYEEVAIDQHLKVHRNSDEQIGGDHKLLVGGGDGEGNQDIHIKKKKHELIDDTSDLHVKKAVKELFDETYDQHVKNDVTQSFDKKLDLTVGNDAKLTYKTNLDVKVGAQRTETVSSGYDLKVGGDMKEQYGGSFSQTVGSASQVKAGSKHAVDAGQEIHLKAGMQVVIEAANITLQGSGGFISITPAGVAISGTMVLINSGGAPSSGSGSSPETPKSAQEAAKAKDAADAKDAKPTKPKDADHSSTGQKSN